MREEQDLFETSETEDLAQRFASAPAETLLTWALERWGSRLALCTSFQAEGMVILDMAWRLNPKLRVFTVDTGRLPQETYDIIERVRDHYKIEVKVFFPDPRQVEAMVRDQGPNLFYKSVEARMWCCHVRKVEPMRRALAGLEAWITGLRRDQSASRARINKIELDSEHGGLMKLNPLCDWTSEQVWNYIDTYNVPSHELYQWGYTSIGCAPCTRPTQLGDDARAGRWWWEQNTVKECGIHGHTTAGQGMMTQALLVKPSTLISPHGDELVNLVVPAEAVDDLKAYANHLPSLQLSERSICDLELLATGGFSPLRRFMNRDDHQRVLEEMRLTSGPLFPIPVTLPVDPGPAIHLDRDVALRNAKNELLAVMTIEEVYEWDMVQVAQVVFGTLDVRHPLAEMPRWGKLNISGRLQVLQLPRHADFQELRLSPAQTRARLAAYASENVVAFQTRNPLHRVHEELIKRAIQRVDGVLLLHPVVGLTKPGDVDHYTRVRTYKALVQCSGDADRILLALLPLAMRLAGPREALWHALIRRNYGANYLIVGRDHASPGVDSQGKPFYGLYDAQALVERYSAELGVGVIPVEELVYLPDEDRYEEVSHVSSRARTASISGTQVRQEYLNKGCKLPDWFTRPEVAEILAEAYPPCHRQGVCLWFTGLSGAGKSTTAEVLTVLLLERGRQATVLDGDVVRTHLSKGLGFSKEDRDTNIRRIGFVAAEIVRHGGMAICAAVSPYLVTRHEVRDMVGQDRFIEVFVDTPLEVCEQRDAKGMYAKARRGEITGFTGIDDPYEPPTHPEITLDTVAQTPEENAHRILDYLIQRGFVRTDAGGKLCNEASGLSEEMSKCP